MKVLETARLILEEAQEEDAEFFHELMNCASWIKFIGDRNIFNLNKAREYIKESLIESYHVNGFGLYKMVQKSTLAPIGICGLVNRSSLPHPDIGFALLPVFEKQGFAFEASLGVLEFAKNSLGFKKIFGITMKENISSRKLLEKLGLQEIGIHRPDDNSEKLLLYEIELY